MDGKRLFKSLLGLLLYSYPFIVLTTQKQFGYCFDSFFNLERHFSSDPIMCSLLTSIANYTWQPLPSPSNNWRAETGVLALHWHPTSLPLKTVSGIVALGAIHKDPPK